MKTVMNFVLLVIGKLKGDMIIKAGRAMLVLGVASASVPTIMASFQGINFTFSSENSFIMDLAGGILIIAGIVLIFIRYITIITNPPYLVYVRGISNMEPSSPMKSLPVNDWHAKLLNYPIASYDQDKLIEKYNHMKITFAERIETQNASKVYVAALASFPALFLIGTLFRNANIETILLDYDRHKTKWFALEPLSKTEDVAHNVLAGSSGIGYEEKLNDILREKPLEVGIALGYTFDIPEEQIPRELRDHTLFLQNSLGYGHDKLSNIETQKQLLDELSVLFNRIHKNKGMEKIHLFVSAQASMTIALGRQYMDNAHGKLVLHNYDNALREYSWTISFNKGDIV